MTLELTTEKLVVCVIPAALLCGYVLRRASGYLKDTLKNILTEDEYNAITNTRVEYRCKYLTFLNRLFAEKK